MQFNSVPGQAAGFPPQPLLHNLAAAPGSSSVPEPPTESGQPVDEPRISDDFGSVLHAAGFLSGSENRCFLSACLSKSLCRKSHVTCMCMEKVFHHLSSRKRCAQHRHRLGSARLARVAQLVSKKPEQGSSQRHVSPVEQFPTEPV